MYQFAQLQGTLGTLLSRHTSPEVVRAQLEDLHAALWNSYVLEWKGEDVSFSSSIRKLGPN